MTPPRWMLLAPVVVTLLLGPTAASAQTTCVPMTTCVENDQVHILREPYLSKTWMVLSMPSPPASDRIYLTNDNVLDQLQKAMRTYSSLDVAVPYDQLDMYSGNDNFQWGWVPQSELINDPNRRAGIPAAAMGWNTTDCWITTSIGKFAYDPSDGVRLMCWTGDWCNPRKLPLQVDSRC